MGFVSINKHDYEHDRNYLENYISGRELYYLQKYHEIGQKGTYAVQNEKRSLVPPNFYKQEAD